MIESLFEGESLLFLELNHANLVPSSLRYVSVGFATSQGTVNGPLEIRSPREYGLLAVVSHQFGLSETKTSHLIDSCRLRHSCPLAERVLVGLIVETLRLFKVQNCSKVETSRCLVERATSLLSA